MMTEEIFVQAGPEVTRDKYAPGRYIRQLVYAGLFLGGLVVATICNLGQKTGLAIFFCVVWIAALALFVGSLRAADR